MSEKPEKHSVKIGVEKAAEKAAVAPPTPEELNTLEVKRVTSEEFPKLAGQIRSLSRNALDSHEGTGLSEREADVTGLDHQYLESAKRGEIYVGMKNDVVIAFVALKKMSGESGKKAVIDQVRFAAGLHKPGRIVRGVLHHVKESLKSEGVINAEIEIEGEHHRISSAESPEFKNFYANIDPDDNMDDDLGAAHDSAADKPPVSHDMEEPEEDISLDAHV